MLVNLKTIDCIVFILLEKKNLNNQRKARDKETSRFIFSINVEIKSLKFLLENDDEVNKKKTVTKQKKNHIILGTI